MDDARFDRLVAALTAAGSRRRLVGSVVSALLGVGFGSREVAAGKKKKHKKCPAQRPVRCHDKCCAATDSCQGGKCVDHCHDGKRNFGESDIDCGGLCAQKCGRFESCAADSDCTSHTCLLLPDLDPSQTICADCRIDPDCAGNSNGPRCVDHFCVTCAADFDCPVSRPFCVAGPQCPHNKPCTCVECRNNDDCEGSDAPLCQDGQCHGCSSGFHACRGQCILFTHCCDNADCPGNQQCINEECGGCVSGQGSGTCCVDADCPPSPNDGHPQHCCDDGDCQDCCDNSHCPRPEEHPDDNICCHGFCDDFCF